MNLPSIAGADAARWQRWLARVSKAFKGTVALLQIPAPDAPQLYKRIKTMECHLVLPLKAAGIGMLLHSFYFSPTPWIGNALGEFDIAVESTQYLLGVYIVLNVISAAILLAMDRIPLAVVEWSIFAISLVDAIFISALTLLTGGYDSVLYWIFLGGIVRSAISVPRGTSQLTLNFTLTLCYLMAGLIEIAVAKNLEQAAVSNPADPVGHLLDVAEDPTEPLVLRSVLLVLMTVCCYAVQVLLERQRQALQQAREFAVREGQLQSAGRLAAEIAHQIKNPLAIISNAAFSVQRALREGGDATEQIRIIQEEVERSDRIITQVMGYAQLSEGRVEKLEVVQELERAIDLVFPDGAENLPRLERRFGAGFPPLLMQPRHLQDILLNLLQNAREAVDGPSGRVTVEAETLPDYTVRISIGDSGPGIAPELQNRVFEPYFTTKEKGTGLGLATVRHNVELYGGTVRLESGLGQGARFIVSFPAIITVKLGNRK
jgi:signal transduction histidine kinase